MCFYCLLGDLFLQNLAFTCVALVRAYFTNVRAGMCAQQQGGRRSQPSFLSILWWRLSEENLCHTFRAGAQVSHQFPQEDQPSRHQGLDTQPLVVATCFVRPSVSLLFSSLFVIISSLSLSSLCLLSLASCPLSLASCRLPLASCCLLWGGVYIRGFPVFTGMVVVTVRIGDSLKCVLLNPSPCMPSVPSSHAQGGSP